MTEGVFETLYAACPDQRREKIDRFCYFRDKRLSAAAYALLAMALKKTGYRGKRPELKHLPGEKPVLRDGRGVHFSLSHSGDVAACAVAESPVGIDVEEFAEYIVPLALAEGERAHIARSKEPQVEFTRLWTLKEACLKYSGAGIRDGLAHMDFHAAPGAAFCSGGRWYWSRRFQGFYLTVCSGCRLPVRLGVFGVNDLVI
ncbi:MAG: 4'-phosphopantetheinyl transferase superfamily protein [Clostridiales Family XIII bacterium]|nr:4'-phosphopantetheinyl transferase superfamily protein [Clostridiales Family XIII bacterium]